MKQAHTAILAGACLALGFRFAGSFHQAAVDMLMSYLMYFKNMLKPQRSATVNQGGSNPTQQRMAQIEISKSLVRGCMDVTAIAISLVMAGSGHLETFRLLRRLRKYYSTTVDATYGNQLSEAASLFNKA